MSDFTRELEQAARAMKRDWDGRARENAKWYVNTARHDQSEEEFDASGAREMEILVLPELALMTEGRDPRGLRLLEIGCGVGRMTKHLAGLFGEVESTDVSGEMVARARQRLAAFSNVRFHETNGVDFAALPDESFDVVFSAYVFQHVPSKDVIVSNIREAWRLARPGGILKLHTNGVEAAEYDALEKDTWTGATFSEAEIRALARELGAQLVSVYGAGTGYCWMTLRKPLPGATVAPRVPRIRWAARADDVAIRAIPTGGDDAWVSLVMSGLGREAMDANRMLVEIGDRTVAPRYAGRVRPHFVPEVVRTLGDEAAAAMYVEAGIPAGMAPGRVPVRIRLESGEVSPPIEVSLVDAVPEAPYIFTVRNREDHGTDVHARGPKSRFRLSVVGLDETASPDNVRIRIGDRTLAPLFVGFVADEAACQVEIQLPPDIEPGPATLRLFFGEVESKPLPLEILPA